jgi:multiple sugar transport system ATP-binding protein
LSNLDAQLRDEMRGEIKRLHQELGKTIVYVTHDQIEAMTLADRMVLMREGVVEQQGTPLDLFEQPATRFVAGFLGSPQMNFIPCRVTRENGAPQLAFEGGERLPLDPARLANLTLWEDRALIFGVRPEHLSASDENADAPANYAALTVCVELVQPTGTRTFVQFRFGGVDVTAELPAHRVQRPGVELRVLVNMAQTILIDRESDRVVSARSNRSEPKGERP